ncbi:MAG: hypothetical protein CBD77_02060 [bacterium TMED217]|nr:MAG: hypothetical protein CBD77_02060 [bacterium TMED217]|tara:strand:+ start:1279 stop:2385 length:1107 start_codon:yes stop_codon:yes gene_type:complete
MKILILNRHNSDAVNGLKKIILSFIDLCRDSEKSTFYYGMQSNGPLTGSLKNPDRIIPFNIDRNISILSDIYNIIRLIIVGYKYKINIVHAHAAKPGMIARVASLFAPFKVIYTPNNWYFEGQSNLKKQIFLFLEQLLSYIPNQTIVAVTDSEEKMIYSKINKKVNVKVIADGIDFSTIKPSTKKDNDFYALENVKKHKKIIGSIIRLDKQKNPLEILQYANYLKNKNIYFVIIGDGELIEECKNYMIKNNLDNILLTGFKDNYSAFFDLFDYTLFTSNNEGLPLIMIESVFNDIKIITKNFRGALDFVTKDIGKILDADSVEKRAFQLYDYIKNDINSVQIDKNIFMNKFSRETMINKYISLYNDTI